MQEISQDKIIKVLDDKINHLKKILEDTIIKHDDVENDLKDLKFTLEELKKKKYEKSLDGMLVMASEWQEE